MPTIVNNIPADLIFLYGAELITDSETALKALNAPNRAVTINKNTKNY